MSVHEPVPSLLSERYFVVTDRVAAALERTGALRGRTVAIPDPTLRTRLDATLRSLGADVHDHKNAHDDASGDTSASELVLDSAALDRAITTSPTISALDTAAWTEVVLRHFARRSNLLVASTPTLVLGDGPVAEHLASALATIGARVERADELRSTRGPHLIPAAVAVVFATGERHPVVTPDAIEPASSHPLVLVDAARPDATGAVDRDAFDVHPTVGAREGIDGRNVGRDVFVIDRPGTGDPTLRRAQADTATAFALAFLAAGAAAPGVGDAAAERLLAKALAT